MTRINLKDPSLMSLVEAEEYFSANFREFRRPRSLARYIRLGLLPAKKVGGKWYVTEADINDFRWHFC